MGDESWTYREFVAAPSRRAALFDEIRDAVLFLASERASFLTGAELTIDGGETIGTVPRA